MNRFVLENTFIKIYIYHFSTNIFINIYIYILFFNNYFYKNKQSKLYFKNRVAVLNVIYFVYGWSKLLRVGVLVSQQGSPTLIRVSGLVFIQILNIYSLPMHKKNSYSLPIITQNHHLVVLNSCLKRDAWPLIVLKTGKMAIQTNRD